MSNPCTSTERADLRLAVASPFVDRRHGTERAVAELLERLARDYHCEIHLYAQRVEGLAVRSSRASGTEQRGEIIWHKVPAIPGPHFLQFVFWLLLNHSCRAWDHLIKDLRCDLVLSPGINCLEADVVVVHVLFHRLRELARERTPSRERSNVFRRLHRRAYYFLLTRLERHVYARSKVALAAVSHRTAALVQEYFSRQGVRAILYGVDAGPFSPKRRLELRAEARARYEFQETDFVLLLIGNDWRNKGLSTVLDAMASTREVPLRLLVAGQDAAAPFFLEAAKSLGLSEQCRWETESVDAIGLYAAADVYVSPSREDSFGLPVLEAMACGMPVVTSAFAGVSQIINEGTDGFVLADPGDTAMLTRHLENLSKHPDMLFRIGGNARSTAEAYTWDRHAEGVWELLNEASSAKQA